MVHNKIAGITLSATAVLAVLAVRLSAPHTAIAQDSQQDSQEVAPALSPVDCSDDGAIRVNVPYVPYTYCYRGIGTRRVDLRQVNSVESRNWTVTVLWMPPGGSWRQTGLISGETLNIQGGIVDTLSVP